jgi:hypothetical protein
MLSAAAAASPLVRWLCRCRRRPSSSFPVTREPLHRHALESIFSLLAFDDLRVVVHVSRLWLQTVRTMRGLSVAASPRRWVADSWRLRIDGATLLSSPLARHIVHFMLSGSSIHWTQPLHATLAAMPSLTRLNWSLDSRGNAEAAHKWLHLPLRWPRMLRSVSLAFCCPRDLAAADVDARLEQLNGLLASLSAHAALEEITLWCDLYPQYPQLPGGIALAPLLTLPRLHTLRIDQGNIQSGPPPFTSEQLQVMRCLPLRTLDCRPSSQRMMADTYARLLCLPGPALQWTTVPHAFVKWLQGEGHGLMHELANLPCLTDLGTHALGDHRHTDAVERTLAVLPRLHALKRLHVGGCPLAMDQRPSCIDRGVRQLLFLPRSLTALCLHESGLQTSELHTLLTLTPNLQVLALLLCYHFDSLSFVQPVAPTLHTLRLLHCGILLAEGQPQPAPHPYPFASHAKLTFAQLAPLRVLTNLTELDLRKSLHPLTSAGEEAQLHPPSVFLPSLRVRDGATKQGEFLDDHYMFRDMLDEQEEEP